MIIIKYIYYGYYRDIQKYVGVCCYDLDFKFFIYGDVDVEINESCDIGEEIDYYCFFY